LTITDLPHHRLIGSESNNDIARQSKFLGFDAKKFHFSLRSDDYLAQWAAIGAGLGIGFAADYVVATNPQVQTLLPELNLPSLPIWLTVHREIRNNGPIRAVYDFLAREVPLEIKCVLALK